MTFCILFRALIVKQTKNNISEECTKGVLSSLAHGLCENIEGKNVYYSQPPDGYWKFLPSYQIDLNNRIFLEIGKIIPKGGLLTFGEGEQVCSSH